MTTDQKARRKAVRARSYAKHREKNLAYAAAYRAANADGIKAKTAVKHATYSARYREKNHEKCLQMTKAWKAANPEKRRAMQAAYLQNNLDRHAVHQQNRRARKRAVGGALSHDLAKRLFKLQRGCCACCMEPLGDDFHLDHIVPLALGGSNTDDNIQLLSAKCNLRKGAKHPVAYMQSLGKLL